MNAADVARAVLERDSGLTAASEIVIEANGMELAAESIERRGNKLALVAGTPTIEDVLESLDRIRASMAEHRGDQPRSTREQA